MMMKNKWIWIGIAVVITVAVAIYFGQTNKEKPLDVTMETTGRRSILETVSANGKIQPEVEVKISPDVSGEIVELTVKEGDKIEKGMLLAKIRPEIYASARDRMEASLNTAKANLANAKARMMQTESRFVSDQASFKRSEKLWKEKTISDAEYETAKAGFEVSAAEVSAAKENVAGAEFGVKSAEAALREASDNLLKTSIFAPMDGTVSMLSVEKGERVVGTTQMAGTDMMRIADLTIMEVNVDVNENDIVKVKPGDLTYVEVDAFLGRKFTGRVTEIANSANTAGMNADQVTTFKVKIRLEKESYADLIPKDKPHLSPFRPGMSATVDIQTGKAENVIAVPIQSVTTREESAEKKEQADENQEGMEMTLSTNQNKETENEIAEECVFINDGGKAKKVVVVTGVQDSRYIEIKSGLAEGAEVITGPYSIVSKELEDGSMVNKVDRDELYKRADQKK